MKRKNVLVITYWSFLDALVQTYTLPYVRMIRKNIPVSSRIYLVTFEQKHLLVSEQDRNRFKKELSEQGVIWIDYHYSKFGVVAFINAFIIIIKMLWMVIAKRIDYIHAWCTPAGTLGYTLSVLTGKPLILDSFEPHAEPSVETGTWKADSIAFKLLFYFEKKQAKRAKFIIAASSFIVGYAKEKWKIDLKNVFVKPALVDLDKFGYKFKKDLVLQKQYDLENKIVCVYAGKVGGIYLDEDIFHFIKACEDYWGDKFRFFMITDTSRELIEKYCNKVNLDKDIVKSLFVEHKEIPRYIGLGDFAINPVKIIQSKKCCTSIKDGEYWATGLPIVITDSVGEDVKIILENNAGVVLQNLSNPEYHNAIEKIDNLLEEYSIKELYDKIRPIAERYRNYNIAEKIYSTVYGNSTFSEK